MSLVISQNVTICRMKCTSTEKLVTLRCCYATFTPGHMLPDTGYMYPGRTSCIRIHKLSVDGYKLLVRDTCRLYLGDITIHLCHGRLVSLCIQQQTGDKIATILSPIQDTCWRQQADTTCIRQHVSWCKRGFKPGFHYPSSTTCQLGEWKPGFRLTVLRYAALWTCCQIGGRRTIDGRRVQSGSKVQPSCCCCCCCWTQTDIGWRRRLWPSVQCQTQWCRAVTGCLPSTSSTSTPSPTDCHRASNSRPPTCRQWQQ